MGSKIQYYKYDSFKDRFKLNIKLNLLPKKKNYKQDNTCIVVREVISYFFFKFLQNEILQLSKYFIRYFPYCIKKLCWLIIGIKLF